MDVAAQKLISRRAGILVEPGQGKYSSARVRFYFYSLFHMLVLLLHMHSFTCQYHDSLGDAKSGERKGIGRFGFGWKGGGNSRKRELECYIGIGRWNIYHHRAHSNLRDWMCRQLGSRVDDSIASFRRGSVQPLVYM